MGVGAERPRNCSGTTAFGANVGRIDLGRIDRYPDFVTVTGFRGVD